MERERETSLERALPIPRSDERIIEREVPIATSRLSPDQALEIAVESYIFAYPLVLMDVTRAVATNTEHVDDGRLHAPVNQFVHVRRFPGVASGDVSHADVDMLSSTLWFDVSREPLIITVLDSGGRYFLLPMLDLWTDVFASAGARTTGTGPQRFAIVGPRWTGALPAGVELIRAPTSLGFLLGRIQTHGVADYDAVRAFQGGLRATPLSAFGKTYIPTLGQGSALISPKLPVQQVAAMDATTFFGRLASLTADNPPHVNDSPLLQRVRRIGVVPGGSFTMDRLAPATADAIEQAVPVAQRKIREYAARAPRCLNGWCLTSNPVGTYGTDYLKRASTAFRDGGALPMEDVIAASTATLTDGTPFDAGARYALRFKNGELPPARASWSLTIYTDRQHFADNPINRYAIGGGDPLRFDDDGSLTLYIQRASPGADCESNWLPTPRHAAFTMTLRLYWPEARALDGRWVPPAVKRIG